MRCPPQMPSSPPSATPSWVFSPQSTFTPPTRICPPASSRLPSPPAWAPSPAPTSPRRSALPPLFAGTERCASRLFFLPPLCSLSHAAALALPSRRASHRCSLLRLPLAHSPRLQGALHFRRPPVCPLPLLVPRNRPSRDDQVCKSEKSPPRDGEKVWSRSSKISVRALLAVLPCSSMLVVCSLRPVDFQILPCMSSAYTRGQTSSARDSVHLSKWPNFGSDHFSPSFALADTFCRQQKTLFIASF